MFRRRVQFALRRLFGVTTLAAVMSAIASLIYRNWQWFDSLTVLFVVIVLPPALSALALMVALPFAYRRAVAEIGAAARHDAD